VSERKIEVIFNSKRENRAVSATGLLGLIRQKVTVASQLIRRIWPMNLSRSEVAQTIVSITQQSTNQGESFQN